LSEAVRATADCQALIHARPDSDRVGLVKAGSVLLLLREEEQDYYKVAFSGRPVFIPKSCAVRAGPEEARAAGLGPAEEEPDRWTQFMLAFLAVVATALVAGAAVGLLWQTAGLVLALVYLAGYVASVIALFVLRRRWTAVGLLAAAPFAAPIFFAMAFLTWFANYYEP
jgi:hypothetical protein